WSLARPSWFWFLLLTVDRCAALRGARSPPRACFFLPGECRPISLASAFMAPSAQVSLESAFLDCFDSNCLVILPRVSGDSKRANELAAVGQANQHASERRYESSIRRRRERINEVRPVLGHAVLDEPGGMTERDARPCLSIRDLEAERTRI